MHLIIQSFPIKFDKTWRILTRYLLPNTVNKVYYLTLSAEPLPSIELCTTWFYKCFVLGVQVGDGMVERGSIAIGRRLYL